MLALDWSSTNPNAEWLARTAQAHWIAAGKPNVAKWQRVTRRFSSRQAFWESLRPDQHDEHCQHLTWDEHRGARGPWCSNKARYGTLCKRHAFETVTADIRYLVDHGESLATVHQQQVLR